MILAGYWLWFALTPLVGSGFNYDQVAVSQPWLAAHGLQGFSAHWQKNANVAAAFDRWFLNLFPVEGVHYGYTSGLTTLNFIPSIGTMILGLLAGDVLRSPRPQWDKIRLFSVAGVVLIAVGWTLGVIGVCPVVKAIWTPSWVLFSGGWSLLLLAGFSALVDVAGATWVVFPLVVIGANSVVAYAISHLYPALAFNALRRLSGPEPFLIFGTAYEPFVYGCAVFVMYWLGLLILYRRRVFIRI